MGDIFNEHIVRRLPTFSDYLMKFGLSVAAVLIMALGFVYLRSMVILIIAAVAAGVYFALKLFDLEYEYIFTNGDLDIDKIVSREKRKHLLTLNAKEFELLAPATPENLQKFEGGRLPPSKDFSSHPKSPNRWFLICPDGAGGRMAVFFEPPEKMVEGIRSFMPGSARSRR